MAAHDQQLLLTVHTKSRLKGKVVQLINSHNLATLEKIKQLCSIHFVDPRDLTSPFPDLQRIEQIPNESAFLRHFSFVSQIQNYIFNQKFDENREIKVNPTKKPIPNFQRSCNFCKIFEHLINIMRDKKLRIINFLIPAKIPRHYFHIKNLKCNMCRDHSKKTILM